MGSVKSFRMNDRTESMFNVIKHYISERTDITDSEILSNGIELQYEQICKDLNEYFADKMLNVIRKRRPLAENIFRKILSVLEILSISKGKLLQDEFWSFLAVNVEQSTVYDVDNERNDRTLVNRQYERILVNLQKDVIDKQEVEDDLDFLHSIFFELFNDDYQEIK